MPLPFPVYFGAVALLVTIGLVASVYLSISHYRVYTDNVYKSFCALSKAINCDTVSQSPYSIFLGLPVPVWGVIGYTFLILLTLFAGSRDAAKKRIWPLIFWITLVFNCYSAILAFISTYFIHSYCILCIASYGVNLLLLMYSWIIQRRFSKTGLIQGTRKDFSYLWQKRVKALPLLFTFLVAIGVIRYFFPAYWTFQAPSLAATIRTGITKNGHPWIGAENPELEIMEFTDYQCFQCKKMHFSLRQLVAENPQKVRLVHRHYPMDHKVNSIVKQPFHLGSGALALISISAASQGRFWEMNDVLYEIDRKNGEIDVREAAQKAGIDYAVLARGLKNKNNLLKLLTDIRQGQRLGITGTPAYLIDGKLYLAQIPPDVIKKALR